MVFKQIFRNGRCRIMIFKKEIEDRLKDVVNKDNRNVPSEADTILIGLVHREMSEKLIKLADKLNVSRDFVLMSYASTIVEFFEELGTYNNWEAGE